MCLKGFGFELFLMLLYVQELWLLGHIHPRWPISSMKGTSVNYPFCSARLQFFDVKKYKSKCPRNPYIGICKDHQSFNIKFKSVDKL